MAVCKTNRMRTKTIEFYPTFGGRGGEREREKTKKKDHLAHGMLNLVPGSRIPFWSFIGKLRSITQRERKTKREKSRKKEQIRG